MLNQCTFLGRLTKDPVLRPTRSGKARTFFTLAVDRDSPDQNGNWITDFIDFVAWDKTAEKVCSKYNKGDLIVATGRLQPRSVTSGDGQTQMISEVVVKDCRKVITGKNNSIPKSIPAADAPADQE